MFLSKHHELTFLVKQPPLCDGAGTPEAQTPERLGPAAVRSSSSYASSHPFPSPRASSGERAQFERGADAPAHGPEAPGRQMASQDSHLPRCPVLSPDLQLRLEP